MTAELRKFQLATALKIAQRLADCLRPFTERIEIVGSIRRRRHLVKDIELLFIPKYRLKAADLFSLQASEMADCADNAIETLVTQGVIAARANKLDRLTWGKENKLAVHVESGIPVDFFATTEDKWWNSLVVRTGGKQTNIRIAKLALEKGWSLEACGTGFRKLTGEAHYQTASEAEVFEFVGLPCLSPPQRP
jgi:DNA polymerase/3'-5' exonuclease PolX